MYFTSKLEDFIWVYHLARSLANIFMCFMEKDWLNECLAAFRPVFYERYIDDTFYCLNIPLMYSLFYTT